MRRNVQVDRLVVRFTGHGSTMTRWFSLPHGAIARTIITKSEGITKSVVHQVLKGDEVIHEHSH